ncbi:MAG: lysophospholipid acyltransferase family protein [Acidimicrobiales bacterium]
MGFGSRDVGWMAGPARTMLAPLVRRLYRTEISGLHNVPTDGPVILSANHLSFFDTPALMVVAPRPVVFLGKAEYMDRWQTRHLFPALGMVPIRREAARSSMAALETAAELLDEGRMVGIYPEGTRSRDGYLHKGHTGVAHLAIKSRAPILPIGLVGTPAIQPIGSSVPRPRGSLKVRFGEPIHPERYRAGGRRRQRQAITDDVMAAIASLTDQVQSPDFAGREPPLIRGGSESVYRVVRARSSSTSWARATDLAVQSAGGRYDDARVGELRRLACRVGADGSVAFETDISLSIKYRQGDAA